jgi:hypothetical protein
MRKGLSIIAIIAAIPLLIFGVVFLIAAASAPGRFFVAVVFVLF